MRRITVLLLICTAVQLAFYVEAFRLLLGQHILTDYLIFYTAGRLLQEGLPLYDLAAQQAVQAPIFGPGLIEGGVLPFNHAPFVAPLAALAAGPDYRASYLRWGLLLIACTLLGAGAVYGLLRSRGWGLPAALLATLGGLLFYPLFVSHIAGQDTPLMVLGALLALAGLPAGRGRAGGGALALLLVKPQLGLMLGAPLLASGRPAGRWFAAVGAVLALLSLALVGPSGVADFVDLIRLSARGEGYGMKQELMYNFNGAALRLAPGLPPAAVRGVGWAVFALTLAGLCVAWRRAGGPITPGRLGVAVVAALLASPHLHFHDLSLLLVPCLALALLVAERGGRWAPAAPAIPAVASQLLMVEHLGPAATHYWIAYALMAALVAGIWQLSRRPAVSAPAREPARARPGA